MMVRGTVEQRRPSTMLSYIVHTLALPSVGHGTRRFLATFLAVQSSQWDSPAAGPRPFQAGSGVSVHGSLPAQPSPAEPSRAWMAAASPSLSPSLLPCCLCSTQPMPPPSPLPRPYAFALSAGQQTHGGPAVFCVAIVHTNSAYKSALCAAHVPAAMRPSACACDREHPSALGGHGKVVRRPCCGARAGTCSAAGRATGG